MIAIPDWQMDGSDGNRYSTKGGFKDGFRDGVEVGSGDHTT